MKIRLHHVVVYGARDGVEILCERSVAAVDDVDTFVGWLSSQARLFDVGTHPLARL